MPEIITGLSRQTRFQPLTFEPSVQDAFTEPTHAKAISDALLRPLNPLRITIATWNVNGIWSVFKSGALLQFLLTRRPTILLLSEVKLGLNRVKKNHSLHNLLHLFGYTYCYWHLQLEGNGGHNGVAAFCRISPICVLKGFIHPTASIDDSKQGRVITLFFPGFSIIHTYVPCSSMPPHPEVPCNPHAPDKDKFRQLFDSNLHDHLRHVRDSHPDSPIMWTGDLNIVPLDEDISTRHRIYKDLDDQSLFPGCKDYERKAFTRTCTSLDLCDAWLHFNPDRFLSRFSYFRNADMRTADIGQRLDYLMCSNRLLTNDLGVVRITDVYIDHDTYGSDHVPVMISARVPSKAEYKKSRKRPDMPSNKKPTSKKAKISHDACAARANLDDTSRADTALICNMQTTNVLEAKSYTHCPSTPTASGLVEHADTQALHIHSNTILLAPMTLSDADVLPDVTHPALCNFPDFIEPDESMSFEKQFDAMTANSTDISMDELKDVGDRIADPSKAAQFYQQRFPSLSALRRSAVVTASVPMAYMDILNTNFKCLFDTGASYSVMSRTAFSRMHAAETQPLGHSFPTFSLADGSHARPAFKANLPLSLPGLSRSWKHVFYIVDNLAIDVILGCNFFMSTGAIADFSRCEIRFTRVNDANPIPFEIGKASTIRGSVAPLVTADSIYLEPGKQYIIRLRPFKDDPLCTDGVCDGLVSRICRGYDPSTTLSTTLTTMRNGHAYSNVANFTNRPIWIRPGTVLGTFKNATCVTPEEAKHALLDNDNKVELRPKESESRDGKQRDQPSGTDISLMQDKPDHKEQSSYTQPANPLCPVDLDSFIPRHGTPEDDPLNELGIPSKLDLQSAKSMLTTDQFDKLVSLIREYNDIFARYYQAPTPTDKMEMKIDVDPNATPHSAPMRRYNPHARTVIVDYVKELWEQGVIEPSNSPWQANVVLIRKPDGSPRVTLDYRRLNDVTRNVASNLPRVEDNFDALGGSRIFSALDIMSAYYCLPLYEPHRDYTAFHCPGLGQFRFTRASMGLRTSQAHFVTLTLRMLDGLLFDCCASYSDDVIVYSKSFDDSGDADGHLSHLRKVFQRFRAYDLKLKASKVHLCQSEVTWLGHVISEDGIRPDPKKIEAVVKMPMPRTLRQLRGLLGSANYFRKFVRGFSQLTSPLRTLLKKNCFRQLDEVQQQTVVRLQQVLTTAPVLKHPDFNKPFVIRCDASPTAIGAVLLQDDDTGAFHPIAYLSKALNDAQRNYSQPQREVLAVLYSLETWRTYIFNTNTTVYTDAQCIEFLAKDRTKYKGRLLRWMLRLSEFNVVIRWVKESQQVIPDCLSRSHPVTGSYGEQPSTQVEPLYPLVDSKMTMDILKPAPQPIAPSGFWAQLFNKDD